MKVKQMPRQDSKNERETKQVHQITDMKEEKHSEEYNFK